MAQKRRHPIAAAQDEYQITTRTKIKRVSGESCINNFMECRDKVPRARTKGVSSMPFDFLELPNELLVLIMTYLNAKQLMRLRCVCRTFMDTIDNNTSIWSKACYLNMWPDSPANTLLFQRGSLANNKECLIKLGLNHLYHFNLNPDTEKKKKNVESNALRSAAYLQHFDERIYPKKPLTWMLIRPPWSSMKKFIYDDLAKSQSDGDPLSYSIGKIESLKNEECLIPAVSNLPTKEFSHSTYATLLQQKSSASDKGSKLQWLRDLHECASSGNLDACFELANYLVANECQDLLSSCKASDFCKSLFQRSINERCNLEQYQTRRSKEMRSIIVDWLAEVSRSKELHQQMLHAAVSYIDRFLMSRQCDRTRLQLLGITCLLLAVKSHSDSRIHVLTIRESSWLTDQTYEYQDVVKMMGEVISALKGDLWHPTSWNYINILLSFFSEESDNYAKCMTHYFHEMSLQYTCFASYTPSLLACATLMLVFITLNEASIWPEKYVKFTGFEVHHLVDCVSLLHHKCFFTAPLKDDRELPLLGIIEKYSFVEYLCVATSITVPSPTVLKSRILAADNMLSCISEDPLKFVVESSGVDDALNMSTISTKTIDYDGDCEDCNEFGIDLSDDEGFSLNRSFLSSYRCEYSVDETSADADSHSLVTFMEQRRLAENDPGSPDVKKVKKKESMLH